MLQYLFVSSLGILIWCFLELTHPPFIRELVIPFLISLLVFPGGSLLLMSERLLSLRLTCPYPHTTGALVVPVRLVCLGCVQQGAFSEPRIPRIFDILVKFSTM
jgi:hypothetical protein